MNRPTPLLLVLVSVSVSALLAGKIHAQAPSRAPDGGTNYRVDGVDLLALPAMPLTGKSSIEWTRTLEDGSSATVHLQANLARDSAAHMYRECRSFVPANLNEEPRLNEIMLFDPDARAKPPAPWPPRHAWSLTISRAHVSPFRTRVLSRITPAFRLGKSLGKTRSAE